MGRGRGLWVGMLGLVLAGTPALAGELPRPAVDYAADVVMTMTPTGQAPMTVNGKVYASKDKERRATTVMGRTSIIITRRDQGLSWILVPEQNMYMEHRAEGRDEEPYAAWDKAGVKLTKLGTERVNGVEATQYRAEVTAQDGHIDTGLLWLTKENIPVRMVAEMADKGGQVTIDYTHIQIGKQDAALFEIPAGYHPMATPRLGNMPFAPDQGGPPGATTPPPSQPTPEQLRQLREQMQQMMKQSPGK